MQTIGRHKATNQEGIFQYKRTADGVYIDVSIGAAVSVPSGVITLTSTEWQQILAAIANEAQDTFRLTAPKSNSVGPMQSLYQTIASAVPKPTHGYGWHDSYKAAVCAILEHEGSVDFSAGTHGPIQLIRDL